MTAKEILRKLEKQGVSTSHHSLEPFDWLVDHGPTDAFDNITAYRLIDEQYQRTFDMASRDWKPVLVAPDEILVDASPSMFSRLLQETRYFDRPGEFQRLLVIQLHRFALDFYNGYEVREKNVTLEGNTLIVSGDAYTGGGPDVREVSFVTRAAPEQLVEFITTPKDRVEKLEF